VAQQVRDLALSLLWLRLHLWHGFNPGPGTSLCCRCGKKKKKLDQDVSYSSALFTVSGSPVLSSPPHLSQTWISKPSSGPTSTESHKLHSIDLVVPTILLHGSTLGSTLSWPLRVTPVGLPLPLPTLFVHSSDTEGAHSVQDCDRFCGYKSKKV